jgi:hypothetical protein
MRGVSWAWRIGGALCALLVLSSASASARGAGAWDSRVPESSAPHAGMAQVAQATPASRKKAQRRRLNVRVGKHKSYTRLVFDWPVNVSYALKEADNTVTVTFDREGRIDLRRLRARLQQGFANPRARVGGGKLVFSIEKPSGLTVRHFRVGPKVVVDFQITAPPKTAAASTPGAGKAATAPDTAARQTDSKIDKPPADVAGARGADESKAPVADKPDGVDQGDTSVAGADPKSAPAADGPEPGAAAEAAAENNADEPAPAPATLTFTFPSPAGAAVFRRGPYIWIVFDQRIRPSIDALRKTAAGLIDSLEQLPVGDGTVIRLRPKAGVNPQTERKGNTWEVTLRRWPIAPQVPIALQVRVDGSEGPEVVFPVTELGQVLHMPDPSVGDMLLIATLRASGHGIPVRRRYPQFDLLASAQGVAVKPLDDDIELQDADARGIALTRPKGLYLSAVSQDGVASGVLTGPRIFHFAVWAQRSAGDFNDVRQRVFRATSEVPKERRDEVRLDLARLYFAHGMAPETLGILRTIEYANSPLAAQPEFHAIKGASLTYMGRHAEARKELLDTRLDRYQEIALWRASMYFHARETEKAAAFFRAGDPVLQGYPEPYKTKFALQRIEAGIDALDVANASMWVKHLDKNAGQLARRDLARLRYYQGLLARQGRDLDRAVKYWADVKSTKDRWNSARAEFALVDLGLQQETISSDEAIDRFERLSFQWRGDDLELTVLKTLGQLYIDKGDYRRGLARLRTAVTYFPDKKASKVAAKLMAATFKSLYLDSQADKLSPLKSLALYDDFRELTPAGPAGDTMIQRLVDRLIAVDLLDRAGELLSHQVRFRLKGHKKAESGAKLALIRLLDRNPKGALLALRASYQHRLPQKIDDDRRRIRAKAMLDLGRTEESIALLAGDVSMDADLLRLDLYWNTKNYAEAAKVLQRLAGEPLAAGTYEDEQAQYILSWAVALRLKRDEPGLKMLRDLYGVGMAKSKLADTFSFIVRSTGGSQADIEAISRRVVEADGFDAFLRNYRERLMPPTTAVSTDKRNQDNGQNPAGANRAGDGAIPPPPPVPQG